MRKGKGEDVTEQHMASVVHAHNCEPCHACCEPCRCMCCNLLVWMSVSQCLPASLFHNMEIANARRRLRSGSLTPC